MGSSEMIDGVVKPRVLYWPLTIQTRWMKTWGLKCGWCGKDFHRFSWFGRPRCPYCGTPNAPQFHTTGI